MTGDAPNGVRPVDVRKRRSSEKTKADRLSRAEQAILQGKGYAAAAKILGVSERYVKKLAQAGRLPRSNRPGFAKRVPSTDKIIAALNAGQSACATARQFGKSEARVRAVRKKALST